MLVDQSVYKFVAAMVGKVQARVPPPPVQNLTTDSALRALGTNK